MLSETRYQVRPRLRPESHDEVISVEGFMDLYFNLYIDPETYLFKACVYNTPFPAIPEALMPEQPRQRPMDMLRVSEHYATVDGLTLPSRYTTTDATGETLFGMHLVLNPSISEEFDKSHTKKPASAEE